MNPVPHKIVQLGWNKPLTQHQHLIKLCGAYKMIINKFIF